MQKLMKLSLLAAILATTTAGKPFVAAHPLIAVMPLAIIEGGTVSTLPKGAKSHTGKVVVLRGRADRKKAPARKAPAAAVTASAAAQAAAVAAAKSCQCATGGVSAGGSSSDVVELRNTDAGLRVMIIGPDGLTRTRYVPAPPGSTARHSQD
jgi:hypothetical protein